MRSHEVHALIRVISFGSVIGKKIITAVETAHELRNHSRIAFDETANVIPEPSIPLQPGYAGESAAELVSARVPWLCDQPQLAYLRICRNFGKNRGMPPVE